MKRKAFIIIGGFTEFIEEYVRSINKNDIEILIMDIESPKYNDLLKYRKRKDHFSNIIREFYPITNKENLLENMFNITKEIEEKYEIIGILPVKEKLIIQSTIIAEYLNLPSIGLEAAITSRNKVLQRRILEKKEWGVKSRLIKKEDILNKILPLKGVIKPADDHGSNGVFLWSNEKEKENVVREVSISNRSTYLLEEKIEGDEYSIESWVKEGEIIFTSITKKIMLQKNEYEYPVEMGHEVHYDELKKSIKVKINEMNKYIIQNSKVNNAIVHLEFKLNNEEIPKVMEWAVRNPGDRIMDLYLYAGKINPYEMYVDILLNKSIFNINETYKPTLQIYYNLDEIPQKISKPFESLLYCPAYHDYGGFVRNRNGKVINNKINIYEIGLLLSPNQKIPEIKNSFSRHGYVILSSEEKINQLKFFKKEFYNNLFLNRVEC